MVELGDSGSANLPWDPQDASDLDLALDLEELMLHWSVREKNVFCGDELARAVHAPNVAVKGADGVQAVGGGSCGSKCQGPLTAEERSEAVQLLRLLAAGHNASAELPSALTLLDALLQLADGQEPSWLQQGLLVTPVFLAAVLRIALKCSRSQGAAEGNFSDDAICAELGYAYEEERMTAMPVTQAELGIVLALDGRIWMPSPSEWAAATLARLSALASGDLRKALQKVLPSTVSWAGLLAERITATAQLPPRALALGALTLGLVGAGLLAPEEVRPEKLHAESWKDSLLAKMEGRGTGGPAGRGKEEGVDIMVLTSHHLAQAACCREPEFRRIAFNAVAQLQCSLCGS